MELLALPFLLLMNPYTGIGIGTGIGTRSAALTDENEDDINEINYKWQQAKWKMHSCSMFVYVNHNASHSRPTQKDPPYRYGIIARFEHWINSIVYRCVRCGCAGAAFTSV